MVFIYLHYRNIIPIINKLSNYFDLHNLKYIIICTFFLLSLKLQHHKFVFNYTLLFLIANRLIPIIHPQVKKKVLHYTLHIEDAML